MRGISNLYTSSLKKNWLEKFHLAEDSPFDVQLYGSELMAFYHGDPNVHDFTGLMDEITTCHSLHAVIEYEAESLRWRAALHLYSTSYFD